MDLKDDSLLIQKYREAHDKEHFWDEIKEGILAVGILEMEIYILKNRLVMIVDAPVDFRWDEAMARLATLPRQGKVMWHSSRTARLMPQATKSGR